MVVYAGSCRLEFSLAGHGAAGKEPSVGSFTDVPARKSKMMAAHHCLVVWTPPLWRLPGLTWASTQPVSGPFVAILR